MRPEVKAAGSPADSYLLTGKTAVLAIIKLAEAFAGGFMLWYLATHMDTFPNVLRSLLEISGNDQGRYASVYQSVFRGIQMVMIVQAALIIPDGLSGFILRFTRKGAGMTAFFRLLSFAACIIGFFLGIAGMVLYCNSVIEAAQSIRRLTIGDLISIFGTGRVAVFLAVYSIVFLILIIYHYRAGRMLLCVKKEIKTGKKIDSAKKNRLGSAAAACGAVFAISIILSVVILTGNEKELTDIAGFLKPILTAYRLCGIPGIAAASVLALKFCLINCCCADFRKAHRETNNA